MQSPTYLPAYLRTYLPTYLLPTYYLPTYLPTYLLTRGGVPRTQKLRSPTMGAQAYQRFRLLSPGVGQNIALLTSPAARTSAHQGYQIYRLNSQYIHLHFLQTSQNINVTSKKQ